MPMKKTFYFLGALLLCMGSIQAQKPSTYVDKKGVLRWIQGNKEVNEFGVHYALPFSTSYENFTTLELPFDKGVDEDVYHLTRLGLKAYRVHIWMPKSPTLWGIWWQTTTCVCWTTRLKK